MDSNGNDDLGFIKSEQSEDDLFSNLCLDELPENDDFLSWLLVNADSINHTDILPSSCVASVESTSLTQEFFTNSKVVSSPAALNSATFSGQTHSISCSTPVTSSMLQSELPGNSAMFMPKPVSVPYGTAGIFHGMFGFSGVPFQISGTPILPAISLQIPAFMSNMHDASLPGSFSMPMMHSRNPRNVNIKAAMPSPSPPFVKTEPSAQQLSQNIDNEEVENSENRSRTRVKDHSSRDSRKRKRMGCNELQAAVRSLEEENERLKVHISNVHDTARMIERKKTDMRAEISAKLTAACSNATDAATSESNLIEVLSRFRSIYADYGDQRKREVKFHLEQLERLILPTQTTKMSLWTLEQDSSFYKNRREGTLSHILTSELGVSDDQVAQIQEHRTRIKRLIQELRESLRLLKQLDCAVSKRHRRLDSGMQELQSVLTPRQTAILIDWVSRNHSALEKFLNQGEAERVAAMEAKSLTNQKSDSTSKL